MSDAASRDDASSHPASVRRACSPKTGLFVARYTRTSSVSSVGIASEPFAAECIRFDGTADSRMRSTIRVIRRFLGRELPALSQDYAAAGEKERLPKEHRKSPKTATGSPNVSHRLMPRLPSDAATTNRG